MLRFTEREFQDHQARVSGPQLVLVEAKERRSKYRSVKTTIDGIEFDSAKEARRWQDLLMLEKAGFIFSLERQVKYEFWINEQLVCSYVADARYIQNGKIVVEDTKSEVTRKLPVFAIKRKLLKACYGLEILLT